VSLSGFFLRQVASTSGLTGAGKLLTSWSDAVPSFWGVGRLWRAVMAGVSVVVAAVTGVVTALATAHPSRGLWAALGAAVVVGALLQVAVTYGEHRKPNHDADSPSADAVTSQGGKYRVDLRGSQGVQVGDGNKQKNEFHSPPTPPAS
jgi:hypothetical protein